MSAEGATEADQIQKLLQARPLIAFAPLMDMQVAALKEVARTIDETLTKSFLGGSQVDGLAMTTAYGLLWLWVLGVYEVLRTMSQAKDCFSSELATRLASEKRYFAKLRMPLAKHEYANRKGPAGLSGMLAGVNLASKDVSFEIQGEVYSARAMLDRFGALMSSVTLADVKSRSPCA